MTIEEFIETTYDVTDVVPGLPFQKIRPRIVCNDGFSLSVQCSEFAYSTPRQNVKKYTAVEIGYPSSEEELLVEYAEDPGSLTGTVYGYVPIEVVREVLNKHRGINISATFPNVVQEAVKKINNELDE